MHSKVLNTLEVCLVALCILLSGRYAAADSITLEWDPNTDSTIGYRLYVGTQSGNYTQNFDVGSATTFTFSRAVAGQRYCCAVAAYASAALECARSSEVCGFSNVPPVLTNPGSQSSIAGQPTSLQLTASDPDGQPVTYAATGLPPGLSLMASTGYISGSGSTAGSYGVTVTASDGVLSSAPQTFTWAISPATTPPPTNPPPSSVTLSAQTIDRVRRDQVLLAWTTASWSEAWVYRNGVVVATTADDGAFTDNIRRASGAYTYSVCAPDATACSNSVTVNF
jgi:hypothetical protein